MPQFSSLSMDTPSVTGAHAGVAAELAAQLGYMKPLEYGPRAAVATHPATEAMPLLYRRRCCPRSQILMPRLATMTSIRLCNMVQEGLGSRPTRRPESRPTIL